MSPVIPCSRSASSLDRVVDGEEGLTCSKAPADITTAFEQAMSSLTVLAEACRAHGIDPMAMLATTMGGAAVQGAVAPPSQSTQMPRGDFDASADSHGLIDALDRGSPLGFSDGELWSLFDGYEIVHDEIVDDVPDWAHDTGKLVRFVARKAG